LAQLLPDFHQKVLYQSRLYIALIGLVLVLTNAMMPLWVTMQYRANKVYYATVLCENVAKPKVKCQGKCQLKKAYGKATADNSQEEGRPTVTAALYLPSTHIWEPFASSEACLMSAQQNGWYVAQDVREMALGYWQPPRS
jgi:hypothetical protein